MGRSRTWESLAPQVLAALDTPAVVTDRAGVIVYVNPAFTRVTGYTADEAVGSTPSLLKSGVHTTEFYRELWETITSGQAWHGQVVNRRKSGELFTDEQRITPLSDEDGTITHFLAVEIDVAEHLSAMAANIPVGIFHADRHGRWSYVNDRLVQLTGRSLDELIGEGWIEAVDTQSRPDVAAAWHRLVAGDSAELSLVTQLGGHGAPVHWVQLRAVRRPDDEAGGAAAIVGSVEEIDELMQTRERLAAREAHLRTILHTAPDGVVVFDDQRRIGSVNEAAQRLLGWSQDELVGSDVTALIPATAHRRGEGAAGTGWFREAVVAVHRSGDTVPVELSVSEARVGAQRVHVAIVRDIAQREAEEADLTFKALHDPLTGLANRTLLDDRLEHALRACRRSRQPLAVFMLDLDHFKAVNDRGGHAAGDELLVRVAGALGATVRAEDTVARLGGDEFVVLTYPVTEAAAVTQLAERIVSRIADDFGRPPTAITASVGVVVTADPEKSVADILRRADAAMYRAKAAGRNRYVIDDTPSAPS